MGFTQPEKAERFLALHRGPALSCAALGAFLRAAQEIGDHGTFRFVKDAIPYAEANELVTSTSSR